MKLISLNMWGGKAHEALVAFLEEQKNSTDIFCFQEVWTSPRADITQSGGAYMHMFEELKELLPDFSAYFFPTQDGFDLVKRVDFETSIGKAIFVRNTIPVLSTGEEFVYLERNGAEGDNWVRFPASFAYVRVPFKETTLTVLNFHGMAFPADKLDTPARLEQSRRILQFAKGEKGEVIICGDFNLFPETESITMFEKDFMNLMKNYSIQTTRSTISPFYGTSEQQNFADYTFVSKGMSVLDFQVPEDCVASDHLPMMLDVTEV